MVALKDFFFFQYEGPPGRSCNPPQLRFYLRFLSAKQLPRPPLGKSEPLDQPGDCARAHCSNRCRSSRPKGSWVHPTSKRYKKNKK